MKFLDADNLRAELAKLCERFNISFGEGSRGFGKALSELPENLFAADVRPERHGAWLDRTDGGEGFVCSNCNGGYTLYDETPFCANCGAKMDEMDGDNNG